MERLGNRETRRGVTLASTRTVRVDGEEKAALATSWVHLELEPSLLTELVDRPRSEQD